MRNLENYNVQELSMTEAKSIDGGSWVVALIAVAIAVIKLVKKIKGGNTTSSGGGGGTAITFESTVNIK